MWEQARTALLKWFDIHRRDLPWRRSRDPYAIWVSEVMLQQTRVAAVLEHYARWMERFPTVQALAGATETEVLTVWSGLGYYRRARLLHRAAQVVVSGQGGRIPETETGLRALPGVGEYTAAAVASIAFGEAVPVVDGNVERVLARVLALTLPARSEVRKGAAALLCTDRPGDANQALMELGATVCLPKNPLCLHCPLQPWCQTRGEHTVAARKPLLARAIVYRLAQDAEGRVLLRQRPQDASLMAGMWELPELREAPTGAEVVLRVRHSITITNYSASVVRTKTNPNPAENEKWCAPGDLQTLPLTGLARKVLRKLALLTG